jgi:hypothetical protein
MPITIKTNNKPRDLLSPCDLTLRELSDFTYLLDDDHQDDYDSMTEDHKRELWASIYDARFFRYKGQVYDLSQFVYITPQGSKCQPFGHHDHTGELADWQGILTDSYFSAIVVRYVDDCQAVVVGLALS